MAIVAFAGTLALLVSPANAGSYGAYGPSGYGAAPLLDTWSGFYVGGNLGAAFGQSSRSIKDLSVEQDLTLKSSSRDEFLGGVHAGYNWQLDNYLLGIEGDADFANNINVLGSIRGRLGLAYSSWLLYGTAGVAFIDTDENFTVVSADDGPFKFSHGNNDTGFVVGGGIDYRIAQNVSVGAEGLFYGFNNDDARFIAGGSHLC